MTIPSKTLLIAALCAVCAILAGGCMPIKARAQSPMFFLPPSPRAALALDALGEPPPVPAYSSVELPAILEASPADARSRADELVRQAGERLKRGRTYYQVKDLENARKEFDGAVGLMLEAAGLNPAGREAYQPILDSMVEAIHRYDLEDLGAATVDDGTRFEKPPLDDILSLTFPVDPKLKDKVREQVAATVSQLPLTVNDAPPVLLNVKGKVDVACN